MILTAAVYFVRSTWWQSVLRPSFVIHLWSVERLSRCRNLLTVSPRWQTINSCLSIVLSAQPTMVKYVLHFFRANARGESIRMAFKLAGVDFEEVTIEFSDWPEQKDSKLYGQWIGQVYQKDNICCTTDDLTSILPCYHINLSCEWANLKITKHEQRQIIFTGTWTRALCYYVPALSICTPTVNFVCLG